MAHWILLTDLLGWPSHHVCQDVICFGEAWSLLEDPVIFQWLNSLFNSRNEVSEVLVSPWLQL